MHLEDNNTNYEVMCLRNKINMQCQLYLYRNLW